MGILNNGALTVTGSTISGNTTSGNGGGILSTGTLTVTDSTVSGNSASGGSGGIGGGIYSDTLTLTGSTVSGNTASCTGLPCSTAMGGGIYSAVTLANSIVAGNGASTTGAATAVEADIDGVYTDNGGSVVGTSSTGTSNVNPGLSSLQYNGVGATLETLIPLPGSVAICAGLASKIPSGTTTDERGYPLQPTSGYCTSTEIDAGAVQTNYTSVQFVQQPTDTALNTAISPSPTVEVLETDSATGGTDAVSGIPIALDGYSEIVGTLSETTAPTVSQPGTGDQLTATLTLNGPLSITAQSGMFTVSQVTPALSFTPSPASQTYGTAITSASLNA